MKNVRAPSRRWIKERRGALEAKFDNFALAQDEPGFRYWLIDEAELDEDGPEFQAAMAAWRERMEELRARRRRRRR